MAVASSMLCCMLPCVSWMDGVILCDYLWYIMRQNVSSRMAMVSQGLLTGLLLCSCSFMAARQLPLQSNINHNTARLPPTQFSVAGLMPSFGCPVAGALLTCPVVSDPCPQRQNTTQVAP
eukprot:jgi/Ulvmu1/11258/UM073_0030.1